MNTWTIPNRIVAGFLTLFLIALLLGGLSLWRVVDINENVVVMANNSVPSVVSLNKIVQTNLVTARSIRRSMLDASDDPKTWGKAGAMVEAAIKEGDALCNEYPTLLFDDRDGQLFRAAHTSRDALLAVVREALGFLRDGKVDDARILLRDRLDGVVQDSMDRFNECIEYNTGVATSQVEAAQGKVRTSFILIGTALALALLLASLLGYGIIRSTTRALRTISDALENSAAQTATASGQLSSVSQALAAGCSEQGSSVVQTSAALEQMQTMIRSTADNAQRAKELANQARTAAETGSRTMVTMNDAMNAIEESSAEVAKIVKNIDEIAFQTNILALNAAVEAARAGEAGAGFAVVADEVRSLAQRSAAAARETADKIETAIANSRHGSASCSRVGESLGEIAEKVAAADSLVAEIATAAREQTHGIKQIGMAMTQMDGVTRGNAARAEESSSAAAELNSQANLMQEGVEFLRSLVAAGGRAVSGQSHPKLSTSPRYDVSEGRPVRPVPRAASSQIALPLPSAGRIPMPGDVVATADSEDRNFKNF
jgi:methyl-accepting chemotaxis protein